MTKAQFKKMLDERNPYSSKLSTLAFLRNNNVCLGLLEGKDALDRTTFPSTFDNIWAVLTPEMKKRIKNKSWSK